MDTIINFICIFHNKKAVNKNQRCNLIRLKVVNNKSNPKGMKVLIKIYLRVKRINTPSVKTVQTKLVSLILLLSSLMTLNAMCMSKIPRFISPALISTLNTWSAYQLHPQHPTSNRPPSLNLSKPCPSSPQTCSTCCLSVLVNGNFTLSPSALDRLLNQAASSIFLK